LFFIWQTIANEPCWSTSLFLMSMAPSAKATRSRDPKLLHLNKTKFKAKLPQLSTATINLRIWLNGTVVLIFPFSYLIWMLSICSYGYGYRARDFRINYGDSIHQNGEHFCLLLEHEFWDIMLINLLLSDNYIWINYPNTNP
jgi:hypothetical protein